MAKPEVALDFGGSLLLIWLEAGADIPALNMVDVASTYQVVFPMAGTKSEDAAQAFMRVWVQWAGARFIIADLDSAFKDQFLTQLDQLAVHIRCAASQACTLAELSGGTPRGDLEGDLEEAHRGQPDPQRRSSGSHGGYQLALPFEPGSMVYVYRNIRPGKGKKPAPAWTGPATVLGREGSNYWTSRGGRCMLVAAEHLRAAEHEI